MPPSLYYFYKGESHTLNSLGSYINFVTPEAVAPIAECIRKVVGENNASFANAVLSFVHQFLYVKSEVKYPVETLVDGYGDCDTLSLLAASIMKAGGLDVTLFYYKDLKPNHMNVGVYLPDKPLYRSWWMTPVGFKYGGKIYWVAECTPQRSWRVGDQPWVLTEINPLIIPIGNYREKSPAHVSANLEKPLLDSSICASISSGHTTAQTTFKIFGFISPKIAEQPVVIYASQEGEHWRVLGKSTTDNYGNYFFKFNINSTGIWHVKTSWSGALDYAGSDSTTITLLIGDKPPNEASKIKDLARTCASAPKDPVMRAQVAMIYKLFQFLNQSSENKFFEILGSGENLTFNGDFAVLGSMQSNYLFGFVLSKANVSYEVIVQSFSGKCVFQIVRQTGASREIPIRVPINLKENIWYNIEVEASKEYLVARLCEGETLLNNIGVKWKNIDTFEFGILMRCNGSKIASKNLEIEELNQAYQIPTCDYDWESYRLWFYPCMMLFTLGVLAMLMVAIYRKKEVEVYFS
ncbi:MAG: hypothetical protein QXR42_07345 [Candidatus Bathyarchaeia archaeon]